MKLKPRQWNLLANLTDYEIVKSELKASPHSYVTLGKFWNLSAPYFPFCKMGTTNTLPHLMGM